MRSGVNELEGKRRSTKHGTVLYKVGMYEEKYLGVRSGLRKAVGLCERFRKGWGG